MFVPAEDYFKKGLYMFDIGQNDLAGAFYSKSLDQVLALIATILTEFETGVKVGVIWWMKWWIMHFSNHQICLVPESVTTYTVFFTESNIKMNSNSCSRYCMTRGLDISGYTTQGLSDAWLRMLPNLELAHQRLTS